MIRPARLCSVVIASVALMSCTMALNALDGQDVNSMARGRALAQDKCSACHAVGASGTSPHPAAPSFGMIGKKYSTAGLGRELEAIATVGHYEMPRIPISPEDRVDIIAYIESLH